MDIVKIGADRLTNEERETHLSYDLVDKAWTMTSSVPKHFRKALKQGWTPVKQYVYEDGTICEMVLTAPERAVTIRNTEKKQLSDKQLAHLRENKE